MNSPNDSLVDVALPPSQQPKPRPSYARLAIVATLSLIADLTSKNWAESHLGGPRWSIELLPRCLQLVLAKNKGGAWGILQGTSEAIRRPFFLIVSVVAIVFIVNLYQKLEPHQRALKWGLPLVLGGALGNVFDRVRYGYVIDFIDAYVRWGGQTHHWPTFNVADVAICVGVGLMALDMFSSKKPAPKLPPNPPAGTDAVL